MDTSASMYLEKMEGGMTNLECIHAKEEVQKINSFTLKIRVLSLEKEDSKMRSQDGV